MTALPKSMCDDDIADEMQRPLSIRERAVLAERHASEQRVLREQPLNLPAFVRDAFDSMVLDVLPPKTMRDAELVIQHLLIERAGRGLNRSELVKVGIAVATEWNSRKVHGYPRPYGVLAAEGLMDDEPSDDARARSQLEAGTHYSQNEAR